MKLLFAALFALCLLGHAAELTDAEWAAMKKAAKERPRAVIFDNDGDDFSYHDGEPTLEALLAKRTTWLSKYPVSTLAFSVNGSTFQMKVPTENGELDDLERPPADDGKGGKIQRLNIYKWLVENGHDLLQLLIDYAHGHDMVFFAEFRLNDTHDTADTPEKPYPFFPRFKREHPEFLMGSHDKKPPYAEWTSYDFTHQEIRDKFVALVTEVADKYEVDGIYIDLFRWLGTFKSVAWGDHASAEETAMFSDMFRRIRAATEAIGRRRGRPILLAVRCPDSVGYCRAKGFDWEGLMAEGVIDLVFPSGSTHFEPWGNSVALCHKYGVKCYPSIDMPTFWKLPPLQARVAEPCYLARIAAAYQAGADGIYYYNMYTEWCAAHVMPPNAEAIRLKDKRYYISPIAWWPPNLYLRDGNDFSQLPDLYYGRRQATLKPNFQFNFRLECGDDFAALAADGVTPRLQATLLAEAAPAAVRLSINGHEWRHHASYGETHIYAAPPEALRPGVNDIAFALASRTGGNAVLKDFWIDVKMTPPPVPEEVAQWDAASPTELALSAGGHAYENKPAIGECLFQLERGGVLRVLLSTGGTYIDLMLYGNHVSAFGMGYPVPPVTAGWHRLRVQTANDTAYLYIDGRFMAELPMRNVTASLAGTPGLALLDRQNRGLVRQSGLLIQPQKAAAKDAQVVIRPAP